MMILLPAHVSDPWVLRGVCRQGACPAASARLTRGQHDELGGSRTQSRGPAVDHPWAIKIADALTQPHLVLVDTLTEMSRLLPRAAVGASLGRAEVFKAVPPLFVTYFELILGTHPQGNQLQRNEREARTLCMVLDWTLNGETLKLMTAALGRLEVIVTVTSWAPAAGASPGITCSLLGLRVQRC